MRRENTFNPKLAINRVIFSLPRNGLSKYTSRPVPNPEEESPAEEETQGTEGDRQNRPP